MADLAALVQLESACFGAEAWSAGQLRAEFRADREVVVDDPEDAIVGYASVSVVGPDAGLLRIAVDPRWRRRGRGRIVLEAARDAGVRRGAERMLLEVDAQNAAAIGLYVSAGFDTISRRPGYYRGRDALVMQWSTGS